MRKSDQIYLRESKTPVDSNAVSFEHVITTKLVHAELKNPEIRNLINSFDLKDKNGIEIIV
ncbi:hypothetical protein [Ichthyobacterium seriolicida]|uniref:Uncharacterized protein n=1 Tax=Ichthyobacterium seriolicida TaxID=242600 RepID=A0A1J1DZP8_9FLAO|nr:hypothetical protein [Ichthyobacterium seriolicida]BAV95399.1 hypothetical protein JBKA6_1386 [Ichthyobacterium seriolicida]